MAKKSEVKFNLRTQTTEICFEGSESFFQSYISEKLENFSSIISASHNLQNKRDLTEVIESLAINLASLEDSLNNITRLMEAGSQQYTEMVAAVTGYCETIVSDKNSSAELLEATREMQDMNMSFNLQYLMLQNKISHENRQFTLVSNIMKNKHDTAKNAINNIR